MEKKKYKIVNLCVSDKEKNKFLFIKRNKPPFIGYWGMLGGKVDGGEHHKVAASRELFEESGINKEGEFLGNCYEEIHEPNMIIELDIYFYHFSVDENINLNSGDEGELGWIDMSDFENHKLIPSDPLMIRSFILDNKKNVKSIIRREENNYIQEVFEHLE